MYALLFKTLWRCELQLTKSELVTGKSESKYRSNEGTAGMT